MNTIRKISLSGAFVTLFASLSQAYHGGESCGGGPKAGLLLISLAVGYWVLTLAQKSERPLDVLGRIVGGLILIVSVVGLLCSAACGFSKWRKCSKMGASSSCGMPMDKAGCPMSHAATPPSEPPADSQKAQ